MEIKWRELAVSSPAQAGRTVCFANCTRARGFVYGLATRRFPLYFVHHFRGRKQSLMRENYSAIRKLYVLAKAGHTSKGE